MDKFQGDVRDYGQYVPGGEHHFNVQSIMATFQVGSHARSAARELREAGYRDVQLDKVSEVPSGMRDHSDAPFPESLTGEAGPERVLGAANPTESGMATGFQPVTSETILLTVVIEHDQFDRAKGIIRKHGGNYDGGPF